MGVTYNVLLISYGYTSNDVEENILGHISQNMVLKKNIFYTSHCVSNTYKIPQKIYDNVQFDKEYFKTNKNVGMDYLDVMLDLPDDPLIFTLKSMIVEESLGPFKIIEVNIK